MSVRTYKADDQNNVIELWHKVGLLNTNNSPEKDIERKIKYDADHFLITEENEKIVSTIMFGYFANNIESTHVRHSEISKHTIDCTVF